MKGNHWARLLAYATGLVNQELLLQNEYLVAENRIMRAHFRSQSRSYPGPPRISAEVTELVVRFARQNSGWGYDRIAAALANLGHQISDQTVGNILRRHHIAPAPQRSQTTSGKEFIRRHLDVLAGTDFFTVEVLTWRGLVTYYVWFFLHLQTPRKLGGHHPPSHPGVDDPDGP